MNDDEQPNLIFSYSRAMAIADGVLIDITWISREIGFKYPCCVNERLYHHWGDDADVRDVALANLLIQMLVTGYGKRGETDRFYSKVDGEDVVLHVGPGDEGEPVLTLCYSIDL